MLNLPSHYEKHYYANQTAYQSLGITTYSDYISSFTLKEQAMCIPCDVDWVNTFVSKHTTIPVDVVILDFTDTPTYLGESTDGTVAQVFFNGETYTLGIADEVFDTHSVTEIEACVLHELVHIEQMASGRLQITNEGFIWDGHLFVLSGEQRSELDEIKNRKNDSVYKAWVVGNIPWEYEGYRAEVQHLGIDHYRGDRLFYPLAVKLQ